uniref:KIB1-4 beta-propeller domain-containing protein n=1 Tax=Setaria viridis TaxID=4556 RepID=A0A4U6WDH6_SETVI|nr:hypothetical protein SEVIR_1G266900v2 [Setaria viridis]
MASTSKNSPVPPELTIGSKPLIIRFNGGEQESGEIIDPFDADLAEASLEACREWLLMLDEGTKECFLLSLASLCKIPLPPLRTTRELSLCALSSPTIPPDCTIVFSTYDDKYLVYCRPGDEKWRQRKLPDKFVGNIVSSRGRMYVRSMMDTFIAIDVSMPSSYGVHIKRSGIPHPSTMRWRSEESLVESDGKIFLLQFYIHGFRNSEVIDMDIHLLDTSAYVWNKDWMNDGPSWESQDIPCSQTDRKLFAAATKITVGDGSKTSFWDSGWLRWLARWRGEQGKGLRTLIILVLWEIWLERNWRVFQHKDKTVTQITDSIKNQAAMWVAAGAKHLGDFLSG